VGTGRGPTGGVDRQSGQHAPTGRASLVAAAVRSYGPAAGGEDEEAERGDAGSASNPEHGQPVVASATAAAAVHNGVSGIAAASTSRRMSSSHDDDDEEVDDGQPHHVPSALIMGLDEHDDERGQLARALHEATNRVKETYAALKVRVVWLTS